MTAYGTSAVKRFRSTNAQVEALDAAICDFLEEQHPATVRGVFYGMSVRGLVSKDDSGYRKVQRRVLELRRNGDISYDWISDATRWQRKPQTHASLADMLRDAQQFYRRDFWAQHGEYVEIWCEKDALAGVLLEATARWDVPLMVSRGFSSDSYLYTSAASLALQEKPAHVYLFTDYDAAGLEIDLKIREGLRRFAPDTEIHFERAALTARQVREMGLPAREPKPRDVARGFAVCCELDAIPPKTLIDLVDSCIVQHIPDDAYQRHLAIETAERETLNNVRLPGFS